MVVSNCEGEGEGEQWSWCARRCCSNQGRGEGREGLGTAVAQGSYNCSSVGRSTHEQVNR